MSALPDTPLDVTPDQLLADLATYGVSVTRVGTDLRFDGPLAALPAELTAAVRAQASGLFAMLTGFPPIDLVIARSEAHKHTVDEIQSRIDDSRRQAADFPDWAPYADAVAYWTAILAVKLAPARPDDVPDDLPEPEEEAE